jgi:3-methyl-2-oxobutanoate hydroxymethyltransferase
MSVHTDDVRKRRTVLDIKNWKKDGPPLVMLTAYDFALAQAVDAAGVDLILVGDSGGMVSLGYTSTVPVTMDDMVFMTSAVARARPQALVIADMPYLSYEASPQEAIYNAARLIKDAGADAVKLEGGLKRAETIQALTQAGIPVMGHVGLTPQTAQSLGGFKVQGKSMDAAREIIRDADTVQEAGAFSIVLEAIPAALSGVITQRLSIPTIGIGAGAQCDGQVLVTHDAIGLFEAFKPKFVKRYAEIRQQMVKAFEAYGEDVRAKRFPAQEHTFSIDETMLKQLMEEIGRD